MPGWSLTVLALGGLIALPVVTVLSSLFFPAGESWDHLTATVLPTYVTHSLLLMLGVAVVAGSMGVMAAWLVCAYRFPGRRALEWLLIAPLAMPAYIIAYTYTGMLDVTGPVQSALRAWTGWRIGDYGFPEVRSLPGAILMLSLVLYPYVYLLARTAFREQSRNVLDVARSLGLDGRRAFLYVALPMARPAIVAGLSLALMETLADYGTVQYFGVDTFTTGIFRTWFGLGEGIAAARLAALLLVFVLVLLVAERLSRRRARYHHASHVLRPIAPPALRGSRALAACAACVLPVLGGFGIPVLQLAGWAWPRRAALAEPEFLALVGNTLALACVAAAIALGVALFLAYGRRLRPGPWVSGAVTLSGLGYAVPGTVIAVGALLPLAWVDRRIDALVSQVTGQGTGLILSGTLVALLFAYLVRFLPVALRSVEAGLARIRPSMEDAARSLGFAPGGVLRRLHAPMLRPTLLAGALLVFVDVMKELPATLILRPFDFNTLAVRAFELASDERLADAALPALAIVVAGMIPVGLLLRSSGGTEAGSGG